MLNLVGEGLSKKSTTVVVGFTLFGVVVIDVIST
jgi:hypothetical protein